MTADTDQPVDLSSGTHSDSFRRALEAAEVGLWHWDLNTDAVNLSPCAVALLGCDGVQPLDYAGLIQALHPDDRAAAERALQDSIAHLGRFDFDARSAARGQCIRVRGQVLHVGGHASEVTGVLIDASGRRTPREASDSRLAAIVASSDDAIIGKTLDGIMTDWNAGAEAIFGYTAAEAIGQPLTMLLPPGQEDEMVRMLDRIRAGERVEHYQTRRRRKDGSIIDVAITVSPVWDETGKLTGASKVARDITTMKRAQAQLEEREAHLRSVLELDP